VEGVQGFGKVEHQLFAVQEERESEFENVGFQVSGQKLHDHVKGFLRFKDGFEFAKKHLIFGLPVDQLKQSDFLHERVLRREGFTLKSPFLKTLWRRKHLTATFFWRTRSWDS